MNLEEYPQVTDFSEFKEGHLYADTTNTDTPYCTMLCLSHNEYTVVFRVMKSFHEVFVEGIEVNFNCNSLQYHTIKKLGLLNDVAELII